MAKIDRTTLDFLNDLRMNNYREWFQENRPRYEAAKQQAVEVAATLIERINTFDPTLGYPDPRKAMFRINRDTRFSNDKTPYKTNLGMSLSPEGSPKACVSSYYLHIEPQNSFLAAGIYMPEAKHLKMLREAIDMNWEEFSGILNEKKFRGEFADLCREDKILKRAPKGFSEDSPAIEYLKMTSFYAFKPISDELLMSEKMVDHVTEKFKIAAPLHRFITSVIKE